MKFFLFFWQQTWYLGLLAGTLAKFQWASLLGRLWSWPTWSTLSIKKIKNWKKWRNSNSILWFSGEVTPTIHYGGVHLSPERQESCLELSFITKKVQVRITEVSYMSLRAWLFSELGRWNGLTPTFFWDPYQIPMEGWMVFSRKSQGPTQGRIMGRQVWEDRGIVVCEGKWREKELSIFETQLPSLYMPCHCNLCFWV